MAGRSLFMSLYLELKRRNVFRVAIAYLAGAWLLTEVAGTLFPAFGIPDWAFRFVVILLALGFVPALIISWAYELTPEGLKREKDVVRDESITHFTAKRLDGITISLVVVALVFIVADRYLLDPNTAEQPMAPTGVATDDVLTSAPKPAEAHNLPNSIAVLPFANRSANPDDVYFVDGIHDDLLTHISKIGAIKTISRTSVMRYRNSDKSIPEIAGELGVSSILEGSIQRAGDQIRINVQLIDAHSDEHLWAEIYDRKLTASNLFAIQTEVAETVAKALKATLSPVEQRRIRATPTESLEAYEAYLLGHQLLDQASAVSVLEAVDYFRKAVGLDPRFALAWVGLAENYIALAGEKKFPVSETYAKAQASLETALDLDEGLGEAYTWLGLLKFNQNDLEGASHDLERALELSPNYPPLSRAYGLLLEALGREDEALIWREASVRLDPMSAHLRRSYAVALRQAGRIEEAMEQLEIALRIDPDNPPVRDAIATIHWQVFNQLDAAVQNYVELIALDPEQASHYAFLAQLYLDLAEPARASLLLERASRLAPKHRTTIWGKLLLQVNSGETDDSAEYARACLADPLPTPWIQVFCLTLSSRKAIVAGRYDEVLEVYAHKFPELVRNSEPEIDNHNYRAAIDLASLLQRMGDNQKADKLLALSYDFIRKQPRLGWWGGYWISDVQILALKGRKEEALAVLQQAYDEGWRSLWWYYLRHDPNLDLLRDDPRFQRIVAQIEADMSEQMQHVREMEKSGEITTIKDVHFDQQ
jgi:TolB-like protein/tetratricopeptide (TPR) repeat protein